MGRADPPLAGVRVVDLTTAWAGPMAAKMLGFLGAEVIHVKSASRPDVWRHYKHVINPRRYPQGDAGSRQYNRISLFNSQNTDKLSLSLDLKRHGGRETLLKLVAVSDVVISNFTVGTMGRLGLDYGRLRAVRPDLIVVEMPPYGNDGPMSGYTALGPMMEMVSGMASMVGYPGGPPTPTGPSYPDPIGGINGAAAVLTALIHRATTGQGQYVEYRNVKRRFTSLASMSCTRSRPDAISSQTATMCHGPRRTTRLPQWAMTNGLSSRSRTMLNG